MWFLRCCLTFCLNTTTLMCLTVCFSLFFRRFIGKNRSFIVCSCFSFYK